MKGGFIGGVIAAIALVLVFVGCIMGLTRVPVGYESVVQSMSGGVQETTLKTGWHILSPTKSAKKFTVSNEQLLLTKDKREGSKTDESFRVTTSDNATIPVSFQMSYHFDPEKLVETYKKYKGMDGNDIVEQRVKTVLKSRVSEVTTDKSLMDVYSGNRAEINGEITEYLNEKFGEQFGMIVDDASIIDVHPDKQLRTAINNRIEAQQKADQAKAEQETAKVEAETKKIQAENKAEIEIIEAEAEASANKKISASITDELIRMKEAEARLEHGWVTVQGAEAVVTE